MSPPQMLEIEGLAEDLALADDAPQESQLVSAGNAGWMQDPPFPDRIDPFEFGVALELDAPVAEENEKLDVQLRGIVGLEHPRAMLQVNGKSRVMQAGESWGVIEIVSIASPEVRIKVDGVVGVWTLLGHRDGARN